MLLALKYLFIFILQQLANNAVAGHFKRKEKQKKDFFFCQEERNHARKRESNVQLVPKCNYMEHSDDGDASKIFDTI